MITNYDPNLYYARHTFECVFMQWDFSAKMEVSLLGNGTGFSLFSSAIKAAFDEVFDDEEGYGTLLLKRPSKDSAEGEDELEVSIQEEYDLEEICVSIRVINHEPEEVSKG